MKIYDQSQTRKVALKLKEFIDTALEITQREVDKIPVDKQMEIFTQLGKAASTGYTKVDMGLFTTPADRIIN